MKPVRYNLLVVAVVAIASVVIGAEEKKKADASSVTAAEQHKIINPADLQWGDPPPGFPAGAKVAVLSGDPGKSGGLYCTDARARWLQDYAAHPSHLGNDHRDFGNIPSRHRR